MSKSFLTVICMFIMILCIYNNGKQDKIDTKKRNEFVMDKKAKDDIVQSEKINKFKESLSARYKERDMNLAWQFVINKNEGIRIRKSDGFPMYPEIDYSKTEFKSNPEFSDVLAKTYVEDKEKALRYTKRIVMDMANGNPKYLTGIPRNILEENPFICMEFVEAGKLDVIQYIPKNIRLKMPELSIAAMNKNPNVILHVPPEILVKHPKICAAAVGSNYLNMVYVPFEIRKEVFEIVYGKGNESKLSNLNHSSEVFVDSAGLSKVEFDESTLFEKNI